ncbi:MAG TPA: dephospho-CoA kinase [Thiotrichaceae bacterium]|jgi:dephospho-CoA kinase|nr:dephospho-CoA kinase [Thiotrichaceae bacterium]HIM07146.1 dephospho-CoA kinase [Gammaproteobacteria bacterium]
MSAVLRVALTGGIGSGKSTVSSKFHELGAPIIDSDIISRDVVKPESACLHAIINEFGSDVLTNKATLDRDKLRTIVFNDDNAKNKLEEILHPAIYLEIENQLSKVDYPYCITVIPLLVETQAMRRFDRILLVDISEKLQIERTVNRDNSSNIIVEKIIKSQVSRKQRLKYADDIINNSIEIDELNDTVLHLHHLYMELSNYSHKP